MICSANAIHRIQVEATLLLQVDRFCEDVCKAVEAWLVAKGQVSEVAAAIGQLPRVCSYTQGFNIRVL